MNKLDRWFKQFEDYPKLSFEKAKKKYKNALTLDEDEQKKEIDEIILGTMHYIYSYIKRLELDRLEVPSCDIDDIISTIVEKWIQLVKEGKLSVNYYNTFSSITNNIRYEFNKNDENKDTAIMNKIDFIKYFQVYIRLKRVKPNLDFNDFKNNGTIKKNILKNDYSEKSLKKCYELFYEYEEIYEYITRDDNYCKFLSSGDNLMAFYELLNEIYVRKNIKEETSQYTIEDAIIAKADLYDILKELRYKRRKALYDHYYIEKTLTEIASEHNVTIEAVRGWELRGIRDSKRYVRKKQEISENIRQNLES